MDCKEQAGANLEAIGMENVAADVQQHNAHTFSELQPHSSLDDGDPQLLYVPVLDEPSGASHPDRDDTTETQDHEPLVMRKERNPDPDAYLPLP
jgi:hypothetical protein